MPKVKTIGKILKWARESENISIEEVALRLNKDPENIRNWEEEEDFPTYVQLERLAYELYKRPIAIFFFSELPDVPEVRKSFRTFPDFEFERLNRSVLWVIRKGQVMLLNLDELCSGKNPSSRKILDKIIINSDNEAKNISQKIRSFLNITLQDQTRWSSYEDAFSNWRTVLQNFGIFVFKDAFRQDEISGFCLFDKEFPIIYINSSLPKTRQIFTLFHELGHLLMRMSSIDKSNDDYFESLPKENKEIEILCNKLTGNFLVPDEDFEQQIKFIEIFDEKTILKVAKRYWVSREVILRKLLDRNTIDNVTYINLVSKWSKQAIKKGNNKKDSKGGNYYNNIASYLGDRYLDLVFNKYYKKQISSIEAAEYLDINVNNLANFEKNVIFKE